MDDQFMHFWNTSDSAWQDTKFGDVHELRALNPVAARPSDDFDDWSELGGFLSESNTKLARLRCWGHGVFKDKSFLQAAASKLERWALYSTLLSREELESLCAAYAACFSNPSALALWDCDWDSEATQEFADFLLSHLKRLQIWGPGAGKISCTQLGKALKLPNSTVEDLSLAKIPGNLDSLADALQSQHCKLRRLALTGTLAIIQEPLVQVLQSRLEGLEIDLEDLPADERDLSADGKEQVLVEALKASSSLWFLQLSGLPLLTRRLVQEGILKAQKLSHLVLTIRYASDLQGNNLIISELLGSPDCRLQSFIIRNRYSLSNLRKFQEHVLNVLEANYHSQLQELDLGPWTSKSLEQRCSKLLYRNSLNLGKFVGDAGQPERVLKLFMCGHTGVGKTTIATNLLRSSAIPVPAVLQRHRSTQGITVRDLKIGGGETLVVFDLAGQEVYHAFHHYFIRRTENDIFLIVCKVDKNRDKNSRAESEQNLEKLKRLLTYWLRFIVSHQSAEAQTRPKVLVVLNRFCKRAELEYNALDAAKEILEDFSTKLSLLEEENPVLEVVGYKPKQLLVLKESLKRVAKAQRRPPVPRICSELIENKARKWYQIWQLPLGEKTILQLQELSLFMRWKSEDEIKQMKAFKFAMMCLHDMGEAIYFGSTQDAPDVLANHVILDVQWFVQDIIGQFIPQLPRNDDGCPLDAIVDKNPLREKLKRCLAPGQEDPKTKVDIIVKYLEEMSVIIPHWGASHKVIIPTLLKKKFTGWQEGNENRYRYWGRRMQPQEEDRKFTLLPSGVFSIIQSDIAKLCKKWKNEQSLDLGDGWISFTKNAVEVLVLVGGENEKWTDRQWVDTMLMVPEDNIRCAEADEILSCVRDCIFNLRQACPFLRIEEHVLNPKQVEAILHGASIVMQTKLLDHLIDMAKADGLDFDTSWDTRNHSRVGELLMLSEVKQLVQSRQSVVNDFYWIAQIYELKQSTKAMPEFENKDIKNQTEYLQGQFQVLEGHLQQLKVSMESVLDTLRRMEHSLRMNQEQILNGISQMLQHIQVPKFPYCTNEKNFFFKYSNPTGERYSIHYMCESAKLKHPMDHSKYKGVPITITYDWITKHKNVLAPATMVCFFMAKLGATIAGVDQINGLLDIVERKLKASFEGRLKSSIDACFGQSIYIKPPTESEVAEVLNHVKQVAGQEDLTVLMAENFGLSFHDGERAWVCHDHRL